MKKTFSLILAILFAFLLATPAFAENNAYTMDELVDEASKFIFDAVVPFSENELSTYSNIMLGSRVPTYQLSKLQDGDTNETTIHYYPIIANGIVVGLLGVSYESNKFIFTYTEGYSDAINTALEGAEAIALFADGAALSVSTPGTQGNRRTVTNVKFKNPTEKCYPLNAPITARVQDNNNTRIAFPSSYSVNVPTKLQSSFWDCWAACAASLGQFHTGVSYTSMQVAAMLGIVGYGFTPDVFNALSYIYGVVSYPYSAYEGGLPYGYCVYSIYAEGDPIFIGLTPEYGDVGHAAIVRGYTTGSYYSALMLMEPQSGNITVSLDSTAPIIIPLGDNRYIPVEIIITHDLNENYL